MTADHSAARDVIRFALEGVLKREWAEYATGIVVDGLEQSGWQITRRDPAAGRVSIPDTFSTYTITTKDVGGKPVLYSLIIDGQEIKFAGYQIALDKATEATTG